MKLADVSDQEITELRDSYRRDLRTETMASTSVRRQWLIVIAALNEVLRQRHGGELTVLDATKMTRPGDEPLA